MGRRGALQTGRGRGRGQQAQNQEASEQPTVPIVGPIVTSLAKADTERCHADSHHTDETSAGTVEGADGLRSKFSAGLDLPMLPVFEDRLVLAQLCIMGRFGSALPDVS